jgi:hypothetical protein
MTKLINIKKTKRNQKIKFDKHEHLIDMTEYPVSGLTGKVVENLVDSFGYSSITVKLDTRHTILAEYNNCLVFNFPHDDKFKQFDKSYSYSNVKVEVIK